MKKAMAKKSGAKEAGGGDSPARLIDARIKKLGDWRGETLARVRAIIKQADPDVVEEVKWRKPSNSMLGVPGLKIVMPSTPYERVSPLLLRSARHPWPVRRCRCALASRRGWW